MSAVLPIDIAPSRDSSTPLLELRGICKSFPGVKALDEVSFVVWPGEVHMLLGENGAGKSSLMKVLCGAYSADAGEFFHRGKKVAIASGADAKRLGIAVIFQEFSLVPYLDIAQNIFLGREPNGRIPGTIDRRKLYRDARRVLDDIGFDIDPTVTVAKLGVAQQQMVEIAKAVSQNARILVMDEPTAALSDRETELLFGLIRRLKADGVAIVYISHRMAEVFALGDRISVLRDGRRVGEVDPARHDARPTRADDGRPLRGYVLSAEFRGDAGQDATRGEGPFRVNRYRRYRPCGARRRDRRPLRPRRFGANRSRAGDFWRRSRQARERSFLTAAKRAAARTRRPGSAWRSFPKTERAKASR